jgi:aryl-alcohol dehydrogenase-like predicted oxidoreductase
MEYDFIGRSDIKLSRLGFGCCPAGRHGWGRTDEEELIMAVKEALNEGVNLFDTADIYGLGVSETLLGKALGLRRNEVNIATKFGVRKGKDGRICYDNTPSWIKYALEQSLRRLNTDYIDIYQLHYWDRKTPFESIVDTLENARIEGKIRYYGICNSYLPHLNIKELHSGLVSFSFEYSLANRNKESDIANMINKYQLIFISWGSLGQGILGGRYHEHSVFPQSDRRSRPVYVNYHGDKLIKNMDILKEMKKIQKNYCNKTLAQIAIRWVLDYLKSGIALVGIKTPDQIKENCGSFGWKLSCEDIKTMEELSR